MDFYDHMVPHKRDFPKKNFEKVANTCITPLVTFTPDIHTCTLHCSKKAAGSEFYGAIKSNFLHYLKNISNGHKTFLAPN